MQDDPRRPDSHHTTRDHELRLAQGQHLAPDETRDPRPSEEADDREDGEQARSDRGHEHDDQEQRRNAEHCVGEAHQDLVGPPAEVAGDQADDRADEGVDRHRAEPDQQRRCGTVDDARPDIATGEVGAEEMRGPGRLANSPDVDSAWVEPAEVHTDDNGDDQSHENDETEHREAMPKKALQRTAQPATAPVLVIADPWVDDRIRDVGQQAAEEHPRSHDHHHAHHQRWVAI